MVRISGRTFKRVRELGRGSFGVVWEVREVLANNEDGPLLALKWSTPARKDLLEACLLEAEVLQQLREALPASAAAAIERVPQHVAHGIVPPTIVGPMGAAPAGGQHVLLAMSKLEGQPLDQWLYGIDEQCLKTLPIRQLLDGPLPGGRLGERSLAGASRVTVALLRQMGPIFGALTNIAYHRDVSAHNFLIREDEQAAEVQFSVLDFGLAVRSRSWATEWKVRNIAGDPRYFCPTAWMLLSHGHKYVEAHPDAQFRRQYRDRIDHYALGVLSLEVLFALWSGEELADTAGEAVGAADQAAAAARAAQRQALARARAAWREYWTEVMGLFQRFHNDGAQALRQALAKSQGIAQLVAKLRALCSALKAAQGAAAGLAPGSPAEQVFQIAAGLIDWRSSWPTWEELPALTAAPAAPAAEASRPQEASLGAVPEAAHEEEQEEEGTPKTPVTTRRFGHSHRRTNTYCEGESPKKSGRGGGHGPGPQKVPAPDFGAVGEDGKGDAAEAGTEADTQPKPEAAARGELSLAPDATRSNSGVMTPRTAPKISGAPISPATVDQGKVRRFLHRRVWTVDEAISLVRGVPQNEVGFGPSAGSP